MSLKDIDDNSESTLHGCPGKCNQRSHNHARSVYPHILPLQRSQIGQVFHKFNSKTKEHYAHKEKDAYPNRSRGSSCNISNKSEDQKMPQRMEPAPGMKSALVPVRKQGKHHDRRKDDA